MDDKMVAQVKITTVLVCAVMVLAGVSVAYAAFGGDGDEETSNELKDVFEVGDYYTYSSEGYDGTYHTQTTVTEVLPDGMYYYACIDEDYMGGGMFDVSTVKKYLCDIDPSLEYVGIETIDTFMGKVECKVYSGLEVSPDWTDKNKGLRIHRQRHPLQGGLHRSRIR